MVMAQGSHSVENQNLLLCVVAFALIVMTPAVEAQAAAGSSPADPSLDLDHPFNPLGYIASNTLTAVALALVMLVALAQTFYTIRYGSKWMLAMVIGTYTYAAGFICRFGLHYHPDSLSIYIPEYMLIVLSPCGFIAANYVLLGRLATHLSCTPYMVLPVRKLTLIFVSSDLATFCIQAIGGGLGVSTRNPSRALMQASSHVFLAGLVLQLASFSLFTGIYVRFLYRVYTLERDAWERDRAQPWHRDWRTLAGALAISCAGILVRSGFRVVEVSQGFTGHLATTEVFFYALDTLPLIVAVAIYVPFWPARFISGETKMVDVESKQSV